MTGTVPVGMARSRLGNYELIRQLGEGGMGVVYEAEHRLLRRRVAIKTVRRGLSDPMLGKRILVEARAIAALDHPGIVKLYDFGVDGTTPYIVMEWVQGQTLKEMLSGGRRVESMAVVEMLRPVAEALDHAHWNGVVHRDVKPANLLLAQSGRIMIMDFGLAYVLNDRAGTRPGSVLGTADYIAPEQVSGEPVDGRADLYSLASVIFRAVTGRPVFVGNGWAEVAAKRLVEEPPLAYRLLPDIPRYFSYALAMGLERDPVRRPQTCTELMDHLTQALNLDALKKKEREEEERQLLEVATSRAAAPKRHAARLGLARRAATALGLDSR